MFCAAAGTSIKGVMDEIIVLGIESYIKKHGNGGNNNGKQYI